MRIFLLSMSKYKEYLGEQVNLNTIYVVIFLQTKNNIMWIHFPVFWAGKMFWNFREWTSFWFSNGKGKLDKEKKNENGFMPLNRTWGFERSSKKIVQEKKSKVAPAQKLFKQKESDPSFVLGLSQPRPAKFLNRNGFFKQRPFAFGKQVFLHTIISWVYTSCLW